MKKLTSVEIRNMWNKFWEEKEHLIIPSSPLVPINDDSLLFINSGVASLKKYFDGSEVPENKRLANVQKCIRTNDIENVGNTSRHQTFFEMLGNFSIGDYFKMEAITYAYELLTSPDYFAMDPSKIYISVYASDEEAYFKWLSLGIDKERITKLESNYWEIGPGPSGPNTEIFYDRGEQYDDIGDAYYKWLKDEEQERFVEVWNIVFSQYNAEVDKPRDQYLELPNKNIDTGAGLERVAMISQGVNSNFETDLFTGIIEYLEKLFDIKYEEQPEFRVIADHIRTVVVALSDGVLFSNSGRGYVLRRLLRRAVRMGKILGKEEPFLYLMVVPVVKSLQESYPELLKTSGSVKALILKEEELFHKTLSSGEKKLMELIDEAEDNKISGYDVFKLYDTYGFPFELTLEYLNEHNMMTDKDDFEAEMAKQKQLAKDARKQTHNMGTQHEGLLNFKNPSVFTQDADVLNSKVIGLFNEETNVDQITDKGYVVLNETNFYAEAGGQVSDLGYIENDEFSAKVINVQKAPNKQNVLLIEVTKGTLKLNDDVTGIIDTKHRLKVTQNHSAVHLLNYALRTIVNESITQAGSFVGAESFRFDINYGKKITDEILIEIEDFVNNLINEGTDTIIEYMSLEEAKEKGAIALFTEKYDDVVRVVTINNSVELCGGTHVKNSKEIVKMVLLGIELKGNNVYRITGTTNTNTKELLKEAISPYNDEMTKLLTKAKRIVQHAKAEGVALKFDVYLNHDAPRSYRDIVFNKNELAYIKREVNTLEREFLKEKIRKERQGSDSYLKEIKEHDGLSYLIKRFDNYDNGLLKVLADDLFNRMDNNSFILLINVIGDNVNFVSKSNSHLNSNEIVKQFSTNALGNGGGNANFAQGGGISTKKLANDIEALIKSITEE